VCLTESVGRASCGHKANHARNLHPVGCEGYESCLGPVYWRGQSGVGVAGGIGALLEPEIIPDLIWRDVP